MSGDIFGSAASYAQQKRRQEAETPMYNGAPVTMENNWLVDQITESKARKEEEARRADTWNKQIYETLERCRETCAACGRSVDSIRYNGEICFLRMEGQAIRLPIGKIKDKKDLAKAVVRIIGCVFYV